MIFGTGFALALLCPILYGVFEPRDNGFFERLYVIGFLLGLALMVLSVIILAVGYMP